MAADSTPDEPVRVTLRDVYNLVSEIKEDVAQVTGTVTILARAQEGTDHRVDDHEERLRTIEKWLYAIPVSILAGIGSTIASIAFAVAK